MFVCLVNGIMNKFFGENFCLYTQSFSKRKPVEFTIFISMKDYNMMIRDKIREYISK